MESSQTILLETDRLQASPADLDIREFHPPPLHQLHARASSHQRRSRVVGGVSKRVFDILASGSALLVLSPILLGVWAAVRIDSPGPGLFRQRRGGFQGRPFRILKFRT